MIKVGWVSLPTMAFFKGFREGGASFFSFFFLFLSHLHEPRTRMNRGGGLMESSRRQGAQKKGDA